MAKLSDNTNLVAPKDLLFQELSDGESVFLNLDNETYFGLDLVGTDMWKKIIDSNSIKEAFAKLTDEYEIDKATLKKDFDELIETLLENGLVRIA